MNDRTQKWSYSTGERGRNRVRAFEDPRTSILYLEYYEPRSGSSAVKRKRLSLGHRDTKKAKQQADEAAAALGKHETLQSSQLTLQELFDIYLGEVTPTKGKRSQRHDRRAAGLFLRCFGSKSKPGALSRRHWDRFIRERSAGRLKPRKPKGRTLGSVGPRTVARDLKWLRAVFNWVTVAGDAEGGILLERNPFKGFPLPKETSPRRPGMSSKQYERMLAVALNVDWRFHGALVLTHETGHRISAISRLRWADVNFRNTTIRWAKETDKVGFEHQTPLTKAAVKALKALQTKRPGIGDAWVFPSPEDSSESCSRHLLRDWWRRCERLAGVEHVKGLGWHSLRRKFATELKETPLKDLCELGGWKSPQTILMCYQKPDEETMRKALELRKSVRAL